MDLEGIFERSSPAPWRPQPPLVRWGPTCVPLAKESGQKGASLLGFSCGPETRVMAPDCPLSLFFSSGPREVQTVHIIARKPSLSR